MLVLGRGGESPALPGVGLSRAGVPAWFLFLVDGPFSGRSFHPRLSIQLAALLRPWGTNQQAQLPIWWV